MTKWRLRDPPERWCNIVEPAFPYKEYRRGQRELAEAVADAVRSGEVLSVRAPTGFGKTAAIIHGLLLAGAEKVLYLVRTVNEVYPVVRELRRFRSPFTILVSARRTCPLFTREGKLPSHEDFWDNCRLARLKGLCEYYARVDEVDEDDVVEELVSSEEPPLSLARMIASRYGSCPFFTLRKALPKAKFVVATYPYLFRRDIFESVLDPYDYSDFVVVVDEAHTLVNAHQLLEQRLTLDVIEKAIEEVEEYAPEATVVVELLEELYSALEDATPRRITRITRIDKDEIISRLGNLDPLFDAVEEVRDAKLERALLGGENTRMKTWISRVAKWLQVLQLEKSMAFVDPGEGENEYIAVPVDPAIIAGPPLAEAKAVVLASGTLPRRSYVSELLGLERPVRYIDTDLMYGRFVSHRNIYSVVARDVTTRYRERSPAMYRRLASYVALISRGLPGAKLFVYPSYEVMRSIISHLPVELDMIVESRHTSLDEVEEWIRESPSAGVHAVASGKLVEGVEFSAPDGSNLLHTVIMVGVPYPQPDDYILSMEESLAERMDRAAARYYSYEFQTLVRIRQALGRAVRSPEDRAAYFLLDYRYLRKSIREMVEIPVNRVVASIEGLARALAEARMHLSSYSSSSSTNDSIAS